MKDLKSFWVWTCDRCGLKESTSGFALLAKGGRHYETAEWTASWPRGWERLAGKDLCETCLNRVKEALQ